MKKERLTGTDQPGEKATNPSPWRRVWHLGGGSLFPVLAIFVARDVLFILLGIVTALFVIWEIARLTSPGVNQWMAAHLGMILKRQERFRLTGTTYLLFASLLVFFCFEKYVAITSLLFLAIGDFMAATIGQRCGRHRLFDKSLEGSLACLATCLLIGTVMTLANAGISLPALAAGAVAATIIELLPVHLDDNLTIPPVSAAVMTLAGIL